MPEEKTPLPPLETEPIDEKPQAQFPLKKRSWLGRFFVGYWHKKLWTLPLTLLVILGVLVAIPFTRYLLTGWFWRENVTVTVYDSQNNSRVSEAKVTLDGVVAQTDKNGQAKLSSIRVGMHSVTIEKQYYKTASQSYEVPLFARGKNYDAKLEATGRLAGVKVTDKITGQVVSDILVSAGQGNQARTDKDGKAHLVIPADKPELAVTLSGNAYNTTGATIHPSDDNTAQVVPAGKLYFLSKQSGKVDVVKTNFDGSERQVVLAGTGFENDADTSLLASRDWKYLVLKAQRKSGGAAGVYLINTANDGVTVLDESNASFTLIGWSGHRFLYKSDKNNAPPTEPKTGAVKSANAETNQVATLDESEAYGDQYTGGRNYLANFYIIDSGIIYTKIWTPQSYTGGLAGLADKQSAIISMNADGSGKKTLKSFAANQTNYIDARLYKPQEIYFVARDYSGTAAQYFELDDGQIKTAQSSDSDFNKTYPTFLVSPAGAETFWAESRDGKNTLFTGGKNAENATQLAEASEFTPYGWMTDQYLLVQKSNSELYITTKDQLKNKAAPLKVSDYHKPQTDYRGYGYGYGGL